MNAQEWFGIAERLQSLLADTVHEQDFLVQRGWGGDRDGYWSWTIPVAPVELVSDVRSFVVLSASALARRPTILVDAAAETVSAYQRRRVRAITPAVTERETDLARSVMVEAARTALAFHRSDLDQSYLGVAVTYSASAAIDHMTPASQALILSAIVDIAAHPAASPGTKMRVKSGRDEGLMMYRARRGLRILYRVEERRIVIVAIRDREATSL